VAGRLYSSDSRKGDWALQYQGFNPRETGVPSEGVRKTGGVCEIGSDETRMAIKKQEFYEGAALHLIARTGQITSVRYEAPFFLLNDRLWVLLKYCTRGRSPWGFTFTAAEQMLLQTRACELKTAIGLVCGADGVAAISYQSYSSIATQRTDAIHVACYRQHGEHYEVNGPDGTLQRKVSPSSWQRILVE
jgi:hypothetical protein